MQQLYEPTVYPSNPSSFPSVRPPFAGVATEQRKTPRETARALKCVPPHLYTDPRNEVVLQIIQRHIYQASRKDASKGGIGMKFVFLLFETSRPGCSGHIQPSQPSEKAAQHPESQGGLEVHLDLGHVDQRARIDGARHAHLLKAPRAVYVKELSLEHIRAVLPGHTICYVEVGTTV